MRTYFPLKGAVSGYMDNVKTIEAMKADMSRIDTLREAVKTDGIAAPMTESNLENIRDAEGKIMDKAKADNKAKRSMSLDVSFGTAKSHSLSEERTIQAEGSTLHAKDTLTVKTGDDMTVKGSQMSAEEVYLKAGKDIRILSVENSSTAREKENASSASLGGSIGSSGLNGIRASYGRGRKEGKSEEISHTESTIKADYTLSLESGRDTILKGSRIEGEKLQADVGGSLSMESEQDRKTYRENGKNTGISLGYDIPSGKVSGFATAGKSHTDSRYESVINQTGIYAGDEGFDISVKDNTHLKGAVIDSKGDAEKNTLRTGTLSWEDVENKADYRLSGKGIAVNKTPNALYNEKGVTPAVPTGSSGKADSTTRAGIAPGTIMIQDKDNQRQDMAALNRNTRDSLNKLGEIFNKTKVEERQELAGLFGKLVFNYLHDAKLTPNQRAAWHAVIGGIMGQLSNKDFIAGALPAGINEMMIGEIQKAAHGDPALMQWIGAGIGSILASILQFNRLSTDKILLSGIKYNLQKEEIEAIKEALESNGIIKDDKTKKIITKLLQNTSTNANDIIIINASVSAVNKSLIFDMKTGKSYYSEDANSSPSSGIGISINLGNIITSQADKDVNDATFRDQILSGLSVSVGGVHWNRWWN